MENEKRLIDANALLHEYCQANGCNEVNDEVCPNCFAAGLIAEAPTVDAVEVVRCKDCKWYAPNNEGLWIGCAFDTRHPDDVPKADDFCSYGERKDND